MRRSGDDTRDTETQVGQPGVPVPLRSSESATSGIERQNSRARDTFQAVAGFTSWCEQRGMRELAQVQPLHVAAYVEHLQQSHSRPTVKQHLAGIRMLFDWLVLGHIIDTNPAHAVRGPRHSQKKGRTPVLSVEEARILLDSIDVTSLPGLRDRALIGLMVYTFARVGATIGMKVEDYYVQGRRGWIRLHEKGGKRHEMPAHHNLDAYLEQYITAAGIGGERKGPLFRTLEGKTRKLTVNPMSQADVYRMIRRRARKAGIKTEIGCHTFRATGITAYLKNGGRLEVAQQMAGHESSRTTGLYDRRGEEISLDEVERIGI